MKPPVKFEPKLFMVIVAVDEVAVNLYHTLYAVPVPHAGEGVALTAFLKLPVTGVQLTDGFKVAGFAQSTCAKADDEILKKIIIASMALVGAVACNMVLLGF